MFYKVKLPQCMKFNFQFIIKHFSVGIFYSKKQCKYYIGHLMSTRQVRLFITQILKYQKVKKNRTCFHMNIFVIISVKVYN